MNIGDLVPDDRNANRGTKRGLQSIIASIQRDGVGRGILVDKNGKIIAGNKTVESIAQTLGVGAEVILVPTDGNQIVVTQRKDLDLDDSDPNNPARRLAYMDNIAGIWDYQMDPDVVMADIEAGFDFDAIDVTLGDLDNFLGPAIKELLGAGNDPWEEWQNMPEFDQNDQGTPYHTIKVHFSSLDDLERFGEKIGQSVNNKTTWIWFPKQDRENLKDYRVQDES